MPERTFATYVSAGLPRRGDGAKAKYPWPEIFNFVVERQQRIGRDSARPSNVDEAKARRDLVHAELAELDLAARRGELLTVDEFEKRLTDAYARVLGAMAALEPRLAADLEGSMTLIQKRTVIRKALAEIKSELYRAEDVPVD